MADYHRFAPIGLIIAGLAALAAFGLYVVQREWNTAVQVSLILVVVGLALFVILDPDRTRRLLSGRQARYGSNAAVLLLAFSGIVIVLNYLFFENAQDWNLRWDLTEDKQNTLALESIQALEALTDKVSVRVYYTSQNVTGAERATELLDKFKLSGGENFSYQVIDPNENPLAATEDGVTRDGTLVLQMGEQKELVTLVDEQEVTGALIRLMNPDRQKVYFLTGHGEFNFEETGDTSLNQVKTVLEDRNYAPEALNLLATNAIPEDASVLVVPGPSLPYSPEEVGLIQSFLDGGGSLIVLFEPIPLTQFGNDPEPLTQYLRQSWGIEMGNDLIVDLSSNQYFVAVANQYADHVIIQKNQSVVTIFPTARSVRALEDVEGVTKTELISTAQQSWGETDFASIEAQQIAPDEGADLLGPVPLAVVADNSVTGARVIVVGDAEFATNAYYSAYGNGELLLNMVDWAAQQEELINLTSKPVTQRIVVPPNRYFMGLIFLITVIVLPGLGLVSGIVVWVQRRRRA